MSLVTLDPRPPLDGGSRSLAGAGTRRAGLEGSLNVDLLLGAYNHMDMYACV